MNPLKQRIYIQDSPIIWSKPNITPEDRKAVDEKSKVVDFTNTKIVSIGDQKMNQSLLEDNKKWSKSSKTALSSNVKKCPTFK
jgi:hypothetical protein